MLEEAFGEPRLSVEDLFNGRVVLDFSRVRTEEAKVFLAELALRVGFRWAVEHGPLSLCLVIDESHRLLSRAEALQGRVEPVLNRLMREVRKLGVRVLAATKCLTDLPNPCVANFGRVYVMAGAGPEGMRYLGHVDRAYAHVAQGLQVGEAFELKGEARAALSVKVVKWRRFKAAGLRPSHAVVEEAKREGRVEARRGGLTRREEQLLTTLKNLGLSEALVAFKAGRPVSKHHLNKLAELGLVKPHRGGRRLTRLGERLAALIEEA
ncbi:MAG: hypothetical protein DRJ69_02485 [Thermoprotei archaeon]|nr:MAG: hypothetical protein DRJ69_02485 [Thermoprotei archaeon]